MAPALLLRLGPCWLSGQLNDPLIGVVPLLAPEGAQFRDAEA
jgi:hypothetical protein